MRTAPSLHRAARGGPAIDSAPVLGEPVIRVSEVVKRYGGAAALKGVSIDFLPGEIHALMGMNGAGKSTLVKILAGTEAPDSGVISVGGTDHAHLNSRQARKVGVSTVPQRRELVTGLTVAENVMLGDLPRRGGLVRWKAAREAARDALAELGIVLDVDAVVGDLAVPEQTMVEVAREVLRGGRALILDEPTACLGSHDAEQIRALVRRLRDAGKAIIYISHHIDEVLGLADRITVLRDGAVVARAANGEMDEQRLVRAMVGRAVVSERPIRRAATGPIRLSLTGLREGRRSGRWSVDGLDVAVRGGEIVAVLGPAGDAQSRLFDVLSGRRRPEAGALAIDGRPVPLGRIGRVLDAGLRCVTGDRRTLGLVPGLSVDENVMLAADRLDGRRLHTARGLARRAVPLRKAYGIRALQRNPEVANLSGGNQQKVLLAKWLGTRPAAVFLEEPTNGVDVAAMAEIHALVDALAEEGVAVLLASSSAEEVMRLADRVIVVRDGAAVAAHDIDSIERDELVAEVLGGTRT